MKERIHEFVSVERVYRSKAGFIHHKQACMLNPDRVLFTCKTCTKQFSRKENLNKHIEVEHQKQTKCKNKRAHSSGLLEQFENGDIAPDQLYEVQKSNKLIGEGMRQVFMQLVFTETAISIICQSLDSVPVLSAIFKDIMENNSFRLENKHIQLALHGGDLLYPVVSPFCKGTELDISAFIDRVISTEQSTGIFNSNTEDPVYMNIFQADI